MVLPGRQIVARPDSQPGVRPLDNDSAVQFSHGRFYGYIADTDKLLGFYRDSYFVRLPPPYRRDTATGRLPFPAKGDTPGTSSKIPSVVRRPLRRSETSRTISLGNVLAKN